MNKSTSNYKIKLPNNTILLYEKVYLDDGNYKGNFRFCFTSDGDYFFQKNKLYDKVSDSMYDAEFKDEPMFSIREDLVSEMMDAITTTSEIEYKEEYGALSLEKEVWTFFKEGQPSKQITVWADNRPKELQSLKDKLDELILKTTRN